MRSLSRHLVFTMGKGAYTGSAAGRARQRMEGQRQGQHYWMRPCTASHTQSSQEASRSTPKWEKMVKNGEKCGKMIKNEEK